MRKSHLRSTQVWHAFIHERIPVVTFPTLLLLLYRLWRDERPSTTTVSKLSAQDRNVADIAAVQTVTHQWASGCKQCCCPVCSGQLGVEPRSVESCDRRNPLHHWDIRESRIMLANPVRVRATPVLIIQGGPKNCTFPFSNITGRTVAASDVVFSSRCFYVFRQFFSWVQRNCMDDLTYLVLCYLIIPRCLLHYD